MLRFGVGRCSLGARLLFSRLDVPKRLLHAATLERYAGKPITRKTLNELAFPDLSETSLLASANYVRDELPIRLAHRIVEMKTLPYFVLTTPSLHHVYQVYIDAFSSCSKFPSIASMEEELLFHNLLRRVVSESAEVVDLVATGLLEARILSKRLGIQNDGSLHQQMQAWVEILLTSRIGRRVLAEQHIALLEAVRQGKNSGQGDAHVMPGQKNGVVDMRCNVIECLGQAIRAAKRVSIHHYGLAPEVQISGCEIAYLPFVRAHLEYILFELLKNAMRATVEHAGGKRGGAVEWIAELPAVHVFMAEGPCELTIRISDAGGGLKRSQRARVFEYGYTTVGKNVAEDSVDDISGEWFLGSTLSDQGNSTRESPMAGLGFGLPMSR